MKPNYSFFHLIINNSECEELISSFTKESDSRFWDWALEDVRGIIHKFNLTWIDLIKIREDTICGQTHDVKLWYITDSGFLVFTTSFSIISLVRQFLKEEFYIDTTITSFKPQKLKDILLKENYNLEQVYVRDKKEIVKASCDYLYDSDEQLDDLFGISYIVLINGKLASMLISCFGLVKLSFGIKETDIMRICKDVEIF